MHLRLTSVNRLTSLVIHNQAISNPMVTLRARQPVTSAAESKKKSAGNGIIIPPKPNKSVAKSFIHTKSASTNGAENANGKLKSISQRVKIEKDDVITINASKVEEPNSPAKKRKQATNKTNEKTSPKKVKKVEEEVVDLPLLSRQEVILATKIDYPKLPFDLEEAKDHLRSIDVRFESILEQVGLKPFEELIEGKVKELDLFKTLTTSILGQQVSWLAARAICYRFCRLFDQSLPEKPDFDSIPKENLPFPNPIDVCQTDDETLRSAGLSGAKVKYVKDVAKRFSDGRLDARKIIHLNEEDCIKHLVEIKGVGRWTAEMLLMFALRRGNILPVGDLGVQRGMVIFFTSDKNGPRIEDKKRKQKKDSSSNEQKDGEELHDPNEKVPVIEEHLTQSQFEVEEQLQTIDGKRDEHETGPHISAPHSSAKSTAERIPPLPEGISSSLLKSRREGKKAKGNVYLTPPEMEALAAPWAPFRSVAVYMMWALVDS